MRHAAADEPLDLRAGYHRSKLGEDQAGDSYMPLRYV